MSTSNDILLDDALSRMTGRSPAEQRHPRADWPERHVIAQRVRASLDAQPHERNG